MVLNYGIETIKEINQDLHAFLMTIYLGMKGTLIPYVVDVAPFQVVHNKSNYESRDRVRAR